MWFWGLTSDFGRKDVKNKNDGLQRTQNQPFSLLCFARLGIKVPHAFVVRAYPNPDFGFRGHDDRSLAGGGKRFARGANTPPFAVRTAKDGEPGTRLEEGSRFLLRADSVLWR